MPFLTSVAPASNEFPGQPEQIHTGWMNGCAQPEQTSKSDSYKIVSSHPLQSSQTKLPKSKALVASGTFLWMRSRGAVIVSWDIKLFLKPEISKLSG